MWPILWFWACHAVEGVHPVEGGYIRRKVRTERRPGFRIESPVEFYPKRAADFLWKARAGLTCCGRCAISQEDRGRPGQGRLHGCGAADPGRGRPRGGRRAGDDPHARRFRLTGCSGPISTSTASMPRSRSSGGVNLPSASSSAERSESRGRLDADSMLGSLYVGVYLWPGG